MNFRTIIKDKFKRRRRPDTFNEDELPEMQINDDSSFQFRRNIAQDPKESPIQKIRKKIVNYSGKFYETVANIFRPVRDVVCKFKNTARAATGVFGKIGEIFKFYNVGEKVKKNWKKITVSTVKLAYAVAKGALSLFVTIQNENFKQELSAESLELKRKWVELNSVFENNHDDKMNEIESTFKSINSELSIFQKEMQEGFAELDQNLQSLDEASIKLITDVAHNLALLNTTAQKLEFIDKQAKEVYQKAFLTVNWIEQNRILEDLHRRANHDVLIGLDVESDDFVNLGVDMHSEIKHVNYQLGKIYNSTQPFGKVIARDPDLAFKYFFASAKIGYAPAQVGLAKLIEEGFEPMGNMNETERKNEAKKWYDMAARQGNMDALTLKSKYDEVFDFESTLRASEQGHVDATFSLINESADVESALTNITKLIINPQINGIGSLRGIFEEALIHENYRRNFGKELIAFFLGILETKQNLIAKKPVFGAFLHFLGQKSNDHDGYGKIQRAVVEFFHTLDKEDKVATVAQLLYEEAYEVTETLLTHDESKKRVNEIVSVLKDTYIYDQDYRVNFCQYLKAQKRTKAIKKLECE